MSRALGYQAGIDETVAKRFVEVAGAELIAAYEWQKAELNHIELVDPRTARALLHAVCAGRIARDLGLSLPEVWRGLRAFVPLVLQLAGTPRPAAPQPWAWKSEGVARRSRRAPLAGAELLHPME